MKQYGEMNVWAGVDHINLPHDAAWHPNLELYNSADLALSFDSYYSLPLEISPDGWVKHAYMVNYRSSCTMNLFISRLTLEIASCGTHHINIESPNSI